MRILWIVPLWCAFAADPPFRLRPESVECECSKADEYVTRVVIATSVPSEQILWVKLSAPWVHVTFDRSRTPTRLLIDILCKKMKRGDYREKIGIQKFDGIHFIDTGQVIPVTVHVTGR